MAHISGGSAIVTAVLVACVGLSCATQAWPAAEKGAAGAITGTLLPAVAGARVNVWGTIYRDDWGIIAHTTVGSKDGRWRIEGIAPGKYDVEMRAHLRATQGREVEIAAGGTVDLGTVTLAPGGAIAGRVRPARAEAVVCAAPRKPQTPEAKGDVAFVRSGASEYLIDGLAPGVYDISIEANGFQTVRGLESHVTQPEELSAADRAGIEATLAALTKARVEHDYLAILALYSKSFHDSYGRPYDQVREDHLRWAAQEEAKRGQAAGTPRAVSTEQLTTERILYGRGEATAICRRDWSVVDGKTGRTLEGEDVWVWGLRKEDGAWRFTFEYRPEGGLADALTWDPRVSGVRVVAGQVSRGHDWTLERVKEAPAGG